MAFRTLSVRAVERANGSVRRPACLSPQVSWNSCTWTVVIVEAKRRKMDGGGKDLQQAVYQLAQEERAKRSTAYPARWTVENGPHVNREDQGRPK